jgi:hypothetical protein
MIVKGSGNLITRGIGIVVEKMSGADYNPRYAKAALGTRSHRECPGEKIALVRVKSLERKHVLAVDTLCRDST